MNLDDDDSTLLHISWKNVYSGSAAVAKYINRHDLPDVIVTPQEDVIAAALVCNIVNIPLCIAHLVPKQKGIILDCMPKISKPIRSGVYTQSPQPTVMVFSTLIDNNRNAKELVSYYQKKGHTVTTVCIYTRSDVDNPPDYSWVKLTRFAKYTFPWQEQ